MNLIGPNYTAPYPFATGTRRQFKKFVFTHGHGRNIPQGAGLETLVPRMKTAVVTTSCWARHEVWQPNTDIPGPILNVSDAIEYRGWLTSLTPKNREPAMRHNIALKLTANTTPKILRCAKDAGFYIVKIYPDGVTTNSEGGWTSLKDLYPAIEAAVKLNYIIMLHGEEPGDQHDTYDREVVFIDRSFKPLVNDFPGVEFDVQHISCRRTLETVGEMPANITGGLTIHHLIISRNDVLEWKGAKRKGLNPNNHCRPPAQRFEDRDALLKVALHADEPQYSKFHLGPDSAPWMEGDKYCYCGCAGVCTSPVAGPVLVELFENNGRLDHPAFEAFTVRNGARRFKVDVDEISTFELVKESWTVPPLYGGVVPFWAGRALSWTPTEPVILSPELLEVE